MRAILVISTLFLVLMMAGCLARSPAAVAPAISEPTPTLLPVMQMGATERRVVETLVDESRDAVPTIAPIFRGEGSAPDPMPAAARPTRVPAALPTRAAQTLYLVYESVYADRLESGWSLTNSEGVTFSSAQDDHYYQGDSALSFTPRADFGSLFFTLTENGAGPLRRDEVTALRFWLSGGEEPIRLDDLAVAVVGSNAFDYWVEGDDSVDGELSPIFPETRLYYLGLNRAVPPETWVEVELLLDERPEPEYTYVTGFYIKNAEGVRKTIYIDDVDIMRTVSEE